MQGVGSLAAAGTSSLPPTTGLLNLCMVYAHTTGIERGSTSGQ